MERTGAWKTRDDLDIINIRECELLPRSRSLCNWSPMSGSSLSVKSLAGDTITESGRESSLQTEQGEENSCEKLRERITPPSAQEAGIMVRIGAWITAAYQIFFSGNSTSKDQKYFVGLQEYVDKLSPEKIDRELKKLESELDEEGNFPSAFSWEIYRLLRALRKHEYFDETSWKAAEPREIYQNHVIPKLQELSKRVIEEKLFADESKLQEVELLFELTWIRWAKTNLSGYSRALLHLLIDLFKHQKGEGGEASSENLYVPSIPETLSIKGMIELFVELSTMIDRGDFFDEGKSGVAIVKQKLQGAQLRTDYAALMNLPNELVEYKVKIGEEEHLVVHMRHPSPTTYDQTVSPDYCLFIEGLKRKNQALLYACHQRKLPSHIEDESVRTANIRDLENRYDNVFVLVQPMEGALYIEKEEIGKEALKERLLADMFEESDRSEWALPKQFAFPESLKGSQGKEARERLIEMLTSGQEPSNSDEERGMQAYQYRKDFAALFDFVAGVFFSGKRVFTEKEKKELLLIFYDIQRSYIEGGVAKRGKYRVGALVTTCKDGLDRGGANALVRLILMTYLLGKEGDSEYLKEILVRIVMPPFLVGKRGMYPKRVNEGYQAAQRIVKVFSRYPYRLDQFRQGFKELTQIDLQEAIFNKAEHQTAKTQIGAPVLAPSLREKRVQELMLEGAHQVILPDSMMQALQRSYSIEAGDELLKQQIDMDMRRGFRVLVNGQRTLIAYHVDSAFEKIGLSREERHSFLACCQQGAFAGVQHTLLQALGVTEGMDSPIHLFCPSADGGAKYGFDRDNKPLYSCHVKLMKSPRCVQLRGHYILKELIGEDRTEVAELAIIRVVITLHPSGLGIDKAEWEVLPLDAIQKGGSY